MMAFLSERISGKENVYLCGQGRDAFKGREHCRGESKDAAGEENLSGNKKDGYTLNFSVSVFVTCR